MGELKCGMCGATGDHRHYAIVVYEGGQELGRLAPDGTTTTDKIRSAVLTKSRAAGIAEEINASAALAAQVVPF
ncbi:hypothetical protein A5658_03435 [Mycobacterium sp. 1245111.1]|uniref:hypothetical protein n=1 Tax=Mycobacterium sp. 1245111.1 TaxID=1834073 RepID=UPI0007FF101C|nr:hypothetical protein [Mycobacterium sp. 1245111.1]OBK38586.1 hypothetical protein A5658_03435 [Mycobacterium sp. 1245111.1]